MNSACVLDTHIWIWWINQDKHLNSALVKQIASADNVAISSASIYELLWLVNRGRLNLTLEVTAWLKAATQEANVDVLPITADIMQRAATLPPVHGDPLDRMIIATAIVNAHSLISLDEKFADYQDLQHLLIQH